jgi:protein-disulfide isomerase
MLSDYGVENAGTKISDKEKDIFNIELPFIAFLGNGFVIVYEVSPDTVRFIWKDKDISLPVNEFIDIWTGIVLLAESSENSIEPNYKINRKRELLNAAQQYLLLFSIAVLAVLAGIANNTFTTVVPTVPIVPIALTPLYLLGAYISYLLVQKQLHINSIKADEAVFRAILKKRPAIETNKDDSVILFGNPDAKLQLTILTNPFCNPCALMHKRIKKLLRDTENKIGVQYILSSFALKLDFANKYLIAVYLEKDTAASWQIYSEWFEKGKPLKEAFFKTLNLNMDNPAIEIEFQKHATWREKSKLSATPTVLVNGYPLPDNYKIEDLRYLTEFNVNVK